MIPLIDADVLCYEIGFACETGWQQEGTPPFDYAAQMLDDRIGNICAKVGGTQPPILFLTGKTNFRYAIAKRTPYKERASHKPFHYSNIKAYIKGKYDYRTTEGLEADDLLAIEQTRALREFYAGTREEANLTVICTRDKDLRQVPGWHYGWELHNQPEFSLEFVDVIGRITYDGKKIKGTGALFFYSQLLTGDNVDSVPGCDGIGPAKAYKVLKNCTNEKDALMACFKLYKARYGLTAYAEMLEQGRLLWMTRELNEDGSPKLWGRKT